MPYELTIYVDMVNKALIIEREVNKERTKRERNQKKRNRSNDSQRQSNKNTGDSNKRLASDNSGSSNIVRCSRCHEAHANSECRWIIDAYFRCGKIDHKIDECP